mmetsp:Transcript_29018/g.44780  ORF Transcript_29018/g.44780 Transcript_29018/m.44780 type:complete len:206 (-) Transcript_29018:144-761(-)
MSTPSRPIWVTMVVSWATTSVSFPKQCSQQPFGAEIHEPPIPAPPKLSSTFLPCACQLEIRSGLGRLPHTGGMEMAQDRSQTFSAGVHRYVTANAIMRCVYRSVCSLVGHACQFPTYATSRESSPVSDGPPPSGVGAALLVGAPVGDAVGGAVGDGDLDGTAPPIDTSAQFQKRSGATVLTSPVSLRGHVHFPRLGVRHAYLLDL